MFSWIPVERHAGSVQSRVQNWQHFSYNAHPWAELFSHEIALAAERRRGVVAAQLYYSVIRDFFTCKVALVKKKKKLVR